MTSARKSPIFETGARHIRIAEPRDAEAIAEMANALARHVGVGGASMTARTTLDALFATPPTGLEAHVAVLERDAPPIGYAMHHIAYESAYAAKGRYLSDLFVSPSARGLGAGRALMRAVARRADAEGGAFIWWVTTQSEGAAHRLYAQVADIRETATCCAATGAAFRVLRGFSDH